MLLYCYISTLGCSAHANLERLAVVPFPTQSRGIDYASQSLTLLLQVSIL
jgi:hypothetical protein